MIEGTFKGKTEIQRALDRIAKALPDQIEGALYKEALIETKESQRRTPVLTGALRASHVTKKPERSGNDYGVTIEVGGPSAPYAWHVHEDLDAYHKNGQAKFLESTLLESKPYMAKRVADRIDLEKA